MFSYEERVAEEMAMWQPLVDREKDEERRKEAAMMEKKKKWAAAFPVCSEYSRPSSGIKVHTDSSRLYNRLLLMRAADEQWNKNNRYVLKPPLVVNECLRFINVTPEHSSTVYPPYDETLFSIVGQEVRVNDRYTRLKNDKGHYVHGFSVYSIGCFYRDTRLQLDNIQKFITEILHPVDKKKWIPESVKQLALSAQDFLCVHRTTICELIEKNIEDIAVLALRTHDARGRVDLIHRMVEPFRGETIWTHDKVDRLWSNIFSFTIEPLVIPKDQAPLLRSIQQSLLHVFLSFCDNMYSFGTVPPYLDQEFPFYEARQDERSHTTVSPSPFLTTVYSFECAVALRQTTCRLWNSDEFLSSTLTGVQTRSRLGALDSLDRVFSRAFMNAIEAEGDDGKSRPLSFVTIISALLSSSQSCTRALSEEFLGHFTREQRLSRLLSDVKSIYSGAALCSYSASLRGGTASRPIEVREAFSRSLGDGGIPIERRNIWSVDTTEKYGRIVAKIDWPLGYVIHPRLLSLLGEARHFILNLLRCTEIIMDVQCDRDHLVSEECRNQFLFLMDQLLSIITVISELFYKQARNLVDAYFARIDASSSVDDARGHADTLHDRLRDLVGSTGMRKMVRDLVDMLCKLAEEIQLDLVCRVITPMKVFNWQQLVDRERTALITIGKNMTNNVLADLVTMLRIP